MWGHYHPAMKERDQSECRLFELTKNLPEYGVGRLVYNKYETVYDSLNYERITGKLKITDGSIAEKVPDTMWVSLFSLYSFHKRLVN